MLRRSLAGIAVLTLLAGCQQVEPISSESLAAELGLGYQVVDNRPDEQCNPDKADGFCYRFAVSLTAGSQGLPAQGWQLLFSQVSYVQSIEGPFTLEHINGDLHRITPKAEFAGLAPGESVDILMRANFWSVSNSDPMPNYLIALGDETPVVIQSSRELQDPETGLWQMPFVAPLTDPERQLKRTSDDNTPQATAQWLYTENQRLAADGSALPEAGLIPTPQSLTLLEGQALTLARGLRLADNDFGDLSAALARLAQLGLAQSDKGTPLSLSRVDGLGTEGYQLSVSEAGIEVSASEPAGAFYALQSLAGLIRLDRDSIPALQIEDAPRYGYRGLHLDVARNYQGEEVLYKVIDQMAAYKLNTLHLHLADDEGWRLAIPGLPELTELGGQRCFDLSEQRCLLPQLGAGDDPQSSVNGYLSEQEYIELLRYADVRQVEVIPSLDMPGHARAAVRAMALRHQRLMAQGDAEEAGRYLLHDLEDKPEYLSVQYYTDNTINPCLDSSYAFIDKVLEGVQQMHQRAGVPLHTYHIGADETEEAWSHSPRCEALIESELQLDSDEDLTGYFLRRVALLLQQRGIRPAGWSDGMLSAKDQLPGQVSSYSWDLLAWGGHDKTHQQLKLGWDVVLSSPDVLYFDFPYEADPNEGGYYWGARNINTYKVFSLMPDNLPAHAEIWRDRQGNPYQAADTQFALDGERIQGIQAQLWTETVRHPDQVEYKLFPRLLAVAERAWHQADWELEYQPGLTFNAQTQHFQQQEARTADWQRFAALLGQQELAKLDRAGIAYRIPTVGAVAEQNRLQANLIFPGLALEYRIAGGEWQPYRADAPVSGALEVRARSADGQRPGRSLPLEATGTAGQ
ncbi:family 20 glycosylhydrolase [Ferrimonas marina]|uniref:beta-N-acetylhexosaminidase n=1 Tax=Ferrimonas marina TaxID=299255 RepID=A0A1M5YCF5_9GAMM|nr:family 20 glycosylhydrolase [Ferrimonas marina]SHI09707.1 hexosaminidase [Ferrimonas marina]